MQSKASHSRTDQQGARAAEEVSGEEQERLIAILDFWHKLEFFIPFDLDQRINEADEGRIRWFRAKDLADPLDNLWLVNLPDEYELKGFNLYIGVFDKSEITRVCEQVVRSKSQLSPYEELERTNLEGNTCFAKLTISQAGELVFNPERDAVSVSTVPWALGQIRDHGLSALHHSDFEQSKERLSESLQSFRFHRKTNASGASKMSANPLNPTEILALHRLFCEWASYSPPENKPVAVVEIQAQKKKREKTPDNSSESPSAVGSAPCLNEGAKNENANREEESGDVNEPEPEIGILNSFFIQDIERAIATVRSGYVPRSLKSYLTPLAPEHRLNLDSDEGYWAILDALHPKRLNGGHWFDEPDRAMSLMQQFAINSIVQLTDPPHLFSVNGPPGTGKTTLLQDIFAELIVRRARALSCLQKAGEAFQTRNIPVRFSGESDTTWIVRLKPELTVSK